MFIEVPYSFLHDISTISIGTAHLTSSGRFAAEFKPHERAAGLAVIPDKHVRPCLARAITSQGPKNWPPLFGLNHFCPKIISRFLSDSAKFNFQVRKEFSNQKSIERKNGETNKRLKRAKLKKIWCENFFQ